MKERFKIVDRCVVDTETKQHYPFGPALEHMCNVFNENPDNADGFEWIAESECDRHDN